MSDQQQLFPLVSPTGTAPATIQARFEQFDRLNPQVRAKLIEMAKELRSQGFKKIGIKMLFEVLRWHYMREIGPVEAIDGYALNNVFTSHYARAIMKQEEDLRGVFELRTLTAK